MYFLNILRNNTIKYAELHKMVFTNAKIDDILYSDKGNDMAIHLPE